DDGTTFDLLGRQEIGLDLRAVVERDARAAVEARVAFERVEPRERLGVDLVDLARDAARAALHEPGEVVEVAQLERGRGARLADERRAGEQPVVALTREQRAVDEDAHGRATLALGRVHAVTPAAR